MTLVQWDLQGPKVKLVIPGSKVKPGSKATWDSGEYPDYKVIGAVCRLIYVAVVLRYDVIVENSYCENQRFDRILGICEHSVMQNEWNSTCKQFSSIQ